MTNMDPTRTPITNIADRIGKWFQESIMVKLFSIGFLMLILLIPSSWIMELIRERQYRAQDAFREIAQKWSGTQTITGPILVVPFTETEVIDRGIQGKELREVESKAYFLPSSLTINGQVVPEIRKRGIFEAVVYNSSLAIDAEFVTPDLQKLAILEEKVKWHEAYLALGINDVKGINNSPVIDFGGHQLEVEQSSAIAFSAPQHDDGIASAETSFQGIVAKPAFEKAIDFNKKIHLDLNLKGSSAIHFIPVGKSTYVNLKSNWENPSFAGNFLPDTHSITNSGFNAHWKIFHFNRPFPQSWKNNEQRIDQANFGVELLVSVDQYLKNIRSAKYGILIILLTFVALFLIEITQRIRIHPFQYILIGAALIIYYTLLLSFSEHVGFNLAYGISSAATIALVGAYASTFLHGWRTALLFSLLLAIFYGFVYMIIQQEDFSLLLGSIGLFIVIAALMFISRKVKWYGSALGAQQVREN